MDLLKKADKTFRVVLRTDHKINGSTLREPEFNIKHNYQEQYKFYNRCIMKLDSISIASDDISDVPMQNDIITVEYNGSQSNSYDTLTDDQTSLVATIITPSEIEDIGTNTIGVNQIVLNYFPVEITNIFGSVRFKLSVLPTKITS